MYGKALEPSKINISGSKSLISSTASTKGGICVAVTVMVPFHQTEGTKRMVQPGAQTKAPAPVLAEGAAWCETEVA